MNTMDPKTEFDRIAHQREKKRLYMIAYNLRKRGPRKRPPLSKSLGPWEERTRVYQGGRYAKEPFFTLRVNSPWGVQVLYFPLKWEPTLRTASSIRVFDSNLTHRRKTSGGKNGKRYRPNFYVQLIFCDKLLNKTVSVYAHRAITGLDGVDGLTKGGRDINVHHKNSNGLDNRESNLLVMSVSEHSKLNNQRKAILGRRRTAAAARAQGAQL